MKKKANPSNQNGVTKSEKSQQISLNLKNKNDVLTKKRALKTIHLSHTITFLIQIPAWIVSANGDEDIKYCDSQVGFVHYSLARRH